MTGTRAWFCTSPHCLHRHLLQCCFPCCWSCCFNWISFFFLTTNDTFESKDICKDFPLKGRDWFHVQRRLLQKPAVSYKDLKPCRVLVTPGTFRKFYHPRKGSQGLGATNTTLNTVMTPQHFPAQAAPWKLAAQ